MDHGPVDYSKSQWSVVHGLFQMRSKRYRLLREKIDSAKKYSVDEGVALIADMKGGKCDHTVDVAIRLGVDPKQSDQQVRGAVNLPHGLGKKVIVVAIAKGEKEKEAKEAGADFSGGDDLLKKISEGWLEFDKIVATPDMMAGLGKIGKVLGPRGLMPNPKTGTVTFEIGKAVQECKAGKVSFKTDKGGIIHCPIGKVSFEKEKIKDNFKTLMETVHKLKPSSAKGIYFKGVALSTTHSPGIRIDVGHL